MDGDGFPDIVTTDEVFYGDGAYHFTPVALTIGFTPPYVVGDFDGDGRPDIATVNSTYLNAGGRKFKQVKFTNQGEFFAPAVVADFNGDGRDDVAVASLSASYIAIWYSRGDGTFYLGTEIDAGQDVWSLAGGDFNGDGRPDIAAGLFGAHQVCMLFNNGSGQFSRSFFAAGAEAIAITSVDLNKDGKLDLVLTNYGLDFRPPNLDVVFHQ
jgi:hypothetical protein